MSKSSAMSSSKKDALVRQLRGLTNATQADATRLLKANGYRIEAAVDAFYGDEAAMANATAAPGGAGAEERKRDKESRERLSKLFDQYKDDDGDDITIEGAMRMCTDLGISPEDVVMLPLSYYLRSDSIGHFARQHYVDGWRTVDASADTLEAQRRALPRLRAELEEDRPVRGERAREGKPSHGLYRRVYEYTYSLARAEGQKSLALDSATAFWDLVLPSSPTFARPGSQGRFTQAQLELWKRYLAEKTAGRAVSRDTWMMFYDFTAEIDERFEEHDFDGAWPSVIDDFVVWAKGQVA